MVQPVEFIIIIRHGVKDHAFAEEETHIMVLELLRAGSENRQH